MAARSSSRSLARWRNDTTARARPAPTASAAMRTITGGPRPPGRRCGRSARPPTARSGSWAAPPGAGPAPGRRWPAGRRRSASARRGTWAAGRPPRSRRPGGRRTDVRGTKRNSCWSRMTSPSRPWTSSTDMMRRAPSDARSSCTITLMAEAICSRMARTGRSKPAISTMVSSRARASRAVLAWTVVIEPAWPVFMAWSMSRASPPRHSPTTIRSGRIRRALRTRSRMRTSPCPSELAGRDSEPHDVGLLELELGGVLDGDDPLPLGDERRQHVEGRRLAGARSAGDEHVELAPDAGLEEQGRGPSSATRS